MTTISKINLLDVVMKLDKKNMQSLMLKTTRYIKNTGNNIVPVQDLVNDVLGSEVIKEGVNIRRQKLAGKKYKAQDFGRIGMIPIGKVDINIDIQRGIEKKHIAKNILPIFDPRITQPINVIYYPETGRYTCWDGLQTLTTILILISHELIEAEDWETFEVKANIIDADMTVPGACCTVAEAVANFGFRILNDTGRKKVGLYYVMRSEYHGAKLYNSDLQQDLHSRDMWEAMLRHNMHPADDENKHKPGHISHISGMKKMAGHNEKMFNIATFERSIEFLSKHFIRDDGINASFYMAIAELFVQLDVQNIKIGQKSTQFNTERFAEFIKTKYGKVNTSHSFRKIAAKRLERDRTNLGYKTHAWTDDCSLPYMLDDYKNYCDTNGLSLGALPEIINMKEYVK